ncbi:hypothetical protein KIF59_08690 [Enterobacter cloacae subsp. cloacae]|nr:hypothetical protein [Enterobacter cloacae subsp. cloacae]
MPPLLGFTDMGTGSCSTPGATSAWKREIPPVRVLYAAFPVTLLAIANFVGTLLEITGKTVMATCCSCCTACSSSMMNCLRRDGTCHYKNLDERRGRWPPGVRAAPRLACCSVTTVPSVLSR